MHCAIVYLTQGNKQYHTTKQTTPLWDICIGNSGGDTHGPAGKTSHRPNVKYTAQELGGDLCDIFKYLSLLYSKSVKNDCELPHLLGDFVPDPLTDRPALNESTTG